MTTNWAIITGSITLLLLLVAAIVGILQLRVLQVRHRLDTAPFITFDIELHAPVKLTDDSDIEEKIIVIPELNEWAKAKRRARNRYLIVTLANKQMHVGGAATDVRFRLIFEFPKYGTPNTMLITRSYITGSIWLQPGEVYRVAFANLKGLPAASIDIDKISYYDIDRNKYTRGYGYSHWELDNRGLASREFREFH